MHEDETTTVLKRDMLGRVAYPRAQREALLDEFERSGLKGRPFAQVAGIKYQTFANWVQEKMPGIQCRKKTARRAARSL